MDNAIVGVIVGSIITLAVSLITGFFDRGNLKLQLQQQDRNLTISKLETLYELVLQLHLESHIFVGKIDDFLDEYQNSSKELEVTQLEKVNRSDSLNKLGLHLE